MRMSRPKRVLLHLVALVYVVLLTFPLLLMFLNAVRTEADITRDPVALPHAVTSANFAEIFQESTFAVNFRNSFLVAGVTVLLTIVVTAPAGYAMSRFRFRGKSLFSTWLLATQAFPGIIMVLGMFTIFRVFGLLNSRLGLIIMHTSFSMPFSIWLLKGYFDRIPTALEEAALIDGCSRFRALTRVVLPLAVPGILAVGTFSFLLSWNEFFFALIVTRSESVFTLPVFLSRFVGMSGVVRWGPLSAAALLSTLPALLLFMAGQRYLVAGLTQGGVK
ncbi:carbohydrate ABC transporter permease [Candidatus Bipolaricaulota bacterium]|nr:carbohydrate ABC transporter permease [Candidatus Bipolaricaulota bacterium]